MSSLDDGETIPGVDSTGKNHLEEESVGEVELSRMKAVDDQFSVSDYKKSSRQG